MSLSVWQRNIVTESGDVIPDAEIEVFDAGSSSKPDLFSDPDGNSSLTNPFNADSNGFARFYVSGGRYDIAVNGEVLWEDVALGTTQSRDTGPAPDNVPTNQQLADGVERDGGDSIGISSVVFAKEINQPGSPAQVLLLCKATERAFISGTITGSRAANSSVANRSSMLDILVRLGNDGSPSVGFVTGGGRDGRSIDPTNLITTEYDNETYVAIRAAGSGASAGLDRAVFTGVNANGVFQWISDDDALNQQDFSSSDPVSFFGRPGDIVESGSNSNGHYIRWENGEQVCWGQVTGVDINNEDSQTGIWESDGVKWYFPADFTNQEYVPWGNREGTGGLGIGYSPGDTSRLSFQANAKTERTDQTINIAAWGFWK